jgi:molybdenum ABC transporter molybdate-binding protein
MRQLLVIAALAIAAPSPVAADVLLHAAGSLRGAIDQIAAAFAAAGGPTVKTKYGPSGLLRDEILAGGQAEVFASANLEHPRALAAAKRGGPVVLFARNRLCALVRPGLEVQSSTLLDRMLDPQTKLGTSTPKADPSGDYAWAMFGKAEAIKAGAAAALGKKARQLTGGATSPPLPAGRSVYGALVASGEADIFLTYCTNARVAVSENPSQRVVAVPEALAVSADYGLIVMSDASPAAYRFALFILSDAGQQILAAHGFSAPSLAP